MSSKDNKTVKLVATETRWNRDKQYGTDWDIDYDIFVEGHHTRIHHYLKEWYKETFGKMPDVYTCGRGTCEDFEMQIVTTWTLTKVEYVALLLVI